MLKVSRPFFCPWLKVEARKEAAEPRQSVLVFLFSEPVFLSQVWRTGKLKGKPGNILTQHRTAPNVFFLSSGFSSEASCLSSPKVLEWRDQSSNDYLIKRKLVFGNQLLVSDIFEAKLSNTGPQARTARTNRFVLQRYERVIFRRTCHDQRSSRILRR